jgi:hypothetical protein
MLKLAVRVAHGSSLAEQEKKYGGWPFGICSLDFFISTGHRAIRFIPPGALKKSM